MVRINPLSTCGREDLAVVLPAGPDAIVVPKSENRQGVQAEIQHAVNVIRASEIARAKGSGMAVVKGKMIDKPIIERAQKIIRIAEHLDLPIPAPYPLP